MNNTDSRSGGTTTIQLKKTIRYKGGAVLPKGATYVVDATPIMSPVLDKSQSHPKVWGEYVWVDAPFYSVIVDGGSYAVAASDVRVVR